jgi:chromosome segregation ATPase
MDETNLYSFVILTIFMLGVFALLGIIIWVSKSEGKQQRDHDTARMNDFKETTKGYSDVIANALKETISPLAQNVQSAFEKVEESLAITRSGFAQADRALLQVLNNQTEQKEKQDKELALDMDTKSLLAEVAKEIQAIQTKVEALETTNTQQFTAIEKKLAELQQSLVELVKAQEKVG